MKKKIIQSIVLSIVLLFILTIISNCNGPAAGIAILIGLPMVGVFSYLIWGYDKPLQKGDTVYINRHDGVKTAKFVSKCERSYCSIIELDDKLVEVFTSELTRKTE